MLSAIPTYIYPFVLAVIAALVGRSLAGGEDDPRSIAGWILYAVAIGCVVIGFATLWMDHNA
jgi:hypothetical protein